MSLEPECALSAGDVVPNRGSSGFRVWRIMHAPSRFLLAEEYFRSNEGRGYVLRRIPGVRSGRLPDGRREPTLVEVVQTVIDTMGTRTGAARATSICSRLRAWRSRRSSTNEGGLTRSRAARAGDAIDKGTISGEDAFRLYDTSDSRSISPS